MIKPTIFHFKKTGLLTTVQDIGRSGNQAVGVPVSGAMDEKSAQLANYLVGNLESCPVLEITLLGPSIIVEGQAIIALTGANLSATINGQQLPMYQTIKVKNGDHIAFGKPKNGCRAYFAVAGNWLVKKWLDSYSAATTEGEILTPDSIFRKGSQLKIEPILNVTQRIYAKNSKPAFPDLIRVKVMRGPEFSLFTIAALKQFFGKIHQVSQQSNRMGYRLTKSIEQLSLKEEMISSGVLPGTIQITNAGQPIILMKDAQTTGGYPRIAVVASEDLHRIAQLKPLDWIWFSLV